MLDKFKTFVALAKYKSFTVTAQQLFCSQPTISQHIKILEAHYNVQLIQRQKGEVILTPKGVQFLKYVQSILDIHGDLQEIMNEPVKEEKELSVYVSHYLAENFFDELFSMNDGCRACPYKVESSNYKGLKESLIEEKTNFAIMPWYVEDEEIGERFAIDVLFEEKFVLIVPNDHILATRKVIYAKDLQKENILLPLSTFLQQRIRTAIEDKGILPTYSQMSDFNLIQKGVRQNMGIGFIPENSIDEGETGFTVKEVKGIQITRKNALIMNRFKQLDAYEQSYYDSVKINLSK